MADISLGKVVLTDYQVKRLSEEAKGQVNGFAYENGVLTVNHKGKELNDVQKAKIISDVQKIPDELSVEEKEKKDIKDKNDNSITLEDVVKILRIQRIL